ncbi:MAG: ATP-binding protein, partial [Bryobacteraceae bacterium]
PYDQDGDGVIEDHWFNVVYHPLRERDGTVSGMVAVSSEVTAQVISRQNLETVNHRLEEFTYVASHDLREPLRMINMYSQLVQRRIGKGDATLNEYVGYVQQGAARMDRLIQDLLSFSRTVDSAEIEAGKSADLSASLSEALLLLKKSVDESGAVITFQPLPMVQGDMNQFAHVFQNLISNALKYRKPNIRPQICISAAEDGDRWVISIRDNGIGFDPGYADQIFGLFKRLHKDEYSGTGVGLAICQRIVERYGGQVWAESQPGEGATFYFSAARIEQ